MAMDICDRHKCSGCGVCVTACPHNCITLQMNDDGFYYPIINETICINCGICRKVCTENIEKQHKNDKVSSVYAIWSRDKLAKKKSSSGGVAWEISKHIIQKSGIVYGCIFDDNHLVAHKRIDNLDDLKKTQGSKYVQSSLNNVYETIKDDVLSGRPVLFSGTPCQVAAAYNFLSGVDLSNFYTIDLICHGASSPGLFQEYLNSKSLEMGGYIKNIEFRNKEKKRSYYVVKISADDNKTKYISSLQDEYMSCFLRCATYRECCYQCKYSTPERVGDFTLGDFFGVDPLFVPNCYYRDGISSMLINNKKAEKLFSEISARFQFVLRPIDEIICTNHNLIKPSSRPVYRDILLLDKSMSLYEKKEKYCHSSILTYCATYVRRSRLYRKYILLKNKHNKIV